MKRLLVNSFLLLLVVHNFTESSLLRSSAHLWVLFILMCVVFTQTTAHRIGLEINERSDDKLKTESQVFVAA